MEPALDENTTSATPLEANGAASDDAVCVFDEQIALDLLDQDREIMDEVLATFDREAVRYRRALNRTRTSLDCRELLRTAHSLKTAARMVGGLRLARSAEKLESLVEKTPCLQLQRLIDAVQDELETLVAAIKLPRSTD